MRHFALAALAATGVALVVALPAAGKEGVAATLLTKVPLDAPAGTRLHVAWTLTYLDHGRRRRFGASGVFVRLRSAAGASAETGFASGDGDYRATVVVPKGGIGDVQIGLQGWTSGPSGTRESDALFPITNDPLPGQRRALAPTTGWPRWIIVVVSAALGAFAVCGTALVARQRRRTTTMPHSRGVTPTR